MPCVILALSSYASAADQDTDSLQGLPPLVVDVKVVAPVSAGIGEGDLKSAIEARLKGSRVRLATGLDTLLAPKLFVAVTAPLGSMGQFGIGATLSQFVKPWRLDAAKVACSESTAPTLLLVTWNKERDSMVANGHPLIPTRELVEKIIDEFVDDFQKANPK